MNKDCVSRMNSKVTGASSPAAGWEVRPCGMLVQRRSSDSSHNSKPVPNIRVKVKYGSSYLEIEIRSQASFGELKKILAELTGLHTGDQRLIFKEKERDSRAFLDICGVKDGSKIALVVDELSRQRRCAADSRKNAQTEKTAAQIFAITVEVDKLAKQVGSVELEINSGKKVVDTILLNLIEFLMTQLINLDSIDADGDVKIQRRTQVKRVQKYIETLDWLKIKNSGQLVKVPMHQQHQIYTPKTSKNQQEQRREGSLGEAASHRPVVATTKWETF